MQGQLSWHCRRADPPMATNCILTTGSSQYLSISKDDDSICSGGWTKESQIWATLINVVHVMMAPDIINMAASSSSSSSSSSCPPSSSAITITTPGKSILKRPPPQQPSLFSRITRFLPTQAPASQNVTNDESKPLKRAHFILPEIAIVYPISSINPPSTPTLKDEKRAIEDKEKERRKRVVRGSPSGQEFEEWWSMDKVESFYRECCAGCDEQPDPAIKAALKVLGNDSFCTLPELIVFVEHISYQSAYSWPFWCAAYIHFCVDSLRCFFNRVGAAEVGVSWMWSRRFSMLHTQVKTNLNVVHCRYLNQCCMPSWSQVLFPSCRSRQIDDSRQPLFVLLGHMLRR